MLQMMFLPLLLVTINPTEPNMHLYPFVSAVFY